MALATGQVAYYKLEDVNDSVASYTLTNNNSVTFSACKVGNGADFGTTNTTKSLTRTDSLGFTTNSSIVISVATWVYFNSPFGNNDATSIFSIASTNTQQLIFNVRGAVGGATGVDMEVYTLGSTGQKVCNVNYTFNTGQWYHLVWVLNGATYALYINGTSVGTGSTSYPSNGTNGTYTKLAYGTIGNYLSGKLDEFGVWNKALSADEVSQIFNSNRGNAFPLTDTPSLYGGVATWKLDESSGNATDSIGNIVLTNTNVVTYVTAKINKGANFAKTIDMKLLNSSNNIGFTSTSANTFVFWIKFNTMAGGYLFDIATNSGAKRSISIYSDTTKIRVYTWPNDLIPTDTVTSGVWYFVVVTNDGAGTVELFVDNISKGTVALGTTYSPNINSLSVGCQIGTPTTSCDAIIDEVVVFNRKISSAEMTILKNTTSGLQWPWSILSNFGAFLMSLL